MEKNNLENKLLKGINDSMAGINKILDGGVSDITRELQKQMGPKGYARYQAYRNKYSALMSQGKVKEAAELEKQYRESEQV